MSAPTKPRDTNANSNWRGVVGSIGLLIACVVVLFLFFVPLVIVGWPNDGPAVETQFEIQQLTEAIEGFKVANKVAYVPSQIKLCELYKQYTLVENGAAQDDPLDRDSVVYLARVWPMILSIDPNRSAVIWRKDGIDWNGNGTTDDPPVILEGDQCLVFFLGGIPAKGPERGTLGFAHNPRDPASPQVKIDRKTPFFEFPSWRLVIRATAPAGNAGFYSFAHAYRTGRPYIYFSSYGVRNGYNSPIKRRYANGDGDSLQVQPYYKSADPLEFLNPTGFQIISAGADGLFGPGDLWTPQTTPTAGRDDQANFHPGLLGKAP
jgi:hypothetical protein